MLSVGIDGSLRCWNLAARTSRQVEHDFGSEVSAWFCEVGPRFRVRGQRDKTEQWRTCDADDAPAGPWLAGPRNVFSPDGRWALTAPEADKVPRVLDMQSGEVVRWLPRPTSPARCRPIPYNGSADTSVPSDSSPCRRAGRACMPGSWRAEHASGRCRCRPTSPWRLERLVSPSPDGPFGRETAGAGPQPGRVAAGWRHGPAASPRFVSLEMPMGSLSLHAR